MALITSAILATLASICCRVVADNTTSGGSVHPPAVTEDDVRRLSTQTNNCCSILKEFNSLSNQTFEAGTEFTTSLQSYWSAQEQAVQPGCIFVPQSAAAAARAVSVLRAASKYIKGGCPFAVRGGGHTPFAGSANIQNGVTIDTQGLNKITLSRDRKSISIGPGNKWIDVYKTLDPLGLSTSGGRVASVGVGGLTLGGGISFFSPRYGLVCDNVLNYEVATAAGKVLNVNATFYPDLFKALKGGSNNFGIVTRIDMKVFPQGKFWGGFLVSPIQVKAAYFSLFENFAKSRGYDPYAALIASFSFNPGRGGWIIASDIEYTKPTVNASVFRPFLQLPRVFSTLRISSLSDFTTEIAQQSPPGIRDYFGTATFKNSAKMMSKFFDIANSTLYPIAQANDFSFSLSFQPLPQAITKHGFATSANTGNSLGLSANDGDLVNALLVVQWQNPKDDLAINRAAKLLFATAEQEARKLGVYHPYLYLNYAASWQKPIQGYGAQSVAFFKGVSKKYDPEQVFQRLVPGGFKLSA